MHDDPDVCIARSDDVEERLRIRIEELECDIEAVVTQLFFENRTHRLEPAWRQQVGRNPRAVLGPESGRVSAIAGLLHVGCHFSGIGIVRLVTVEQVGELVLVRRETAIRGERDHLRYGRAFVGQVDQALSVDRVLDCAPHAHVSHRTPACVQAECVQAGVGSAPGRPLRIPAGDIRIARPRCFEDTRLHDGASIELVVDGACGSRIRGAGLHEDHT